MAKSILYRFDSFRATKNRTRIELEKGETDDWVYIRRQSHKLADETNEQVMLFIYNDYFRRWDYIGKALPGGDWYDFQDDGPYYLSDDGRNYFKKGGKL